MKLSRKLIPAFAMLLVSAIMLTTASYAWFSINNSVTAKGMSVKTTASDSVLIAEVDINATEVGTATFGTDLSQDVDGTLAPVSTVNGITFFYTDGKNVDDGGKVKEEDGKDEYIAYNESAFNTAFNAKGYVDYTFQIKATNAAAAVQGNENANMKTLAITNVSLRNNDHHDTGKHSAFRVAVFVQAGGASGEYAGALTAEHLVTILTPAGLDTYFDSGKAVIDANSKESIGAKLNAAATLGTVKAGETAYYKVVVRLWLEGEDKTCNNDTFASLVDEDFLMDLSVQFSNDGTKKLTYDALAQ